MYTHISIYTVYIYVYIYIYIYIYIPAPRGRRASQAGGEPNEWLDAAPRPQVMGATSELAQAAHMIHMIYDACTRSYR